jgi:hypothetical protein
MSSNMVRAHGGPPAMVTASGDLRGVFVRDTLEGINRAVKEKHLDHLITNTTGVPAGKPVFEGIITDTLEGVKRTDVPELHKVAHPSKTKPKRYGMVPFAGNKY